MKDIRKKYAALIDHTYLKPDATQNEIDQLIAQAQQYGFKTICVNGTWATYAKSKLINSSVGLTIVIGFPLGAMTKASKLFEAQDALKNGADEIDMVINIGHLKAQKYALIIDEIKAIKHLMPSQTLKVIIETALLTADEIAKATELVIEGQGDFIKTSTGFNGRGASFEDIRIMAKVAKGQIGIKASGGIKTFHDLKTMIDLGATRIGTSAGVSLLENVPIDTQY